MISVEEILLNTGPIPSSKLAAELSKKSKIGIDAAKKRISRATAPVNKITLGFTNNQSFVYHDRQANTPMYWERLEKALRDYSKAYYSIINSHYFHSGYMRKAQLAAYSNSPMIKFFSSRVSYQQIEADLLDVKIIRPFDADTFKISEQIFNRDNFNRFRAIEIVKKQVIEDFGTWAARLNLVSFGAAKVFGDAAQFGGFQWGYTSPSYIQGLNPTFDKTKPGFVVADILLGKNITEADIEFFISKIEILRSRSKLRKFIPVMICEYAEPEAFKTLKSKGAVVGLVNELFGDGYSQMLRLLLETLTDATKIIEKDPDKFYELTKSLSKLKGRFGNIKGNLFELAVGYYYSLRNYPFKISKVITDKISGQSKEIDVFVNDNLELRFVECKSQDAPLERHQVNDWLTKIPIIRRWVDDQDEMRNKKQTFEIWSTSGFDVGALDLLTTRQENNNHLKYRLEYYDRSTIDAKVKETNNLKLKELMGTYFSPRSD